MSSYCLYISFDFSHCSTLTCPMCRTTISSFIKGSSYNTLQAEFLKKQHHAFKMERMDFPICRN